jgi:hypothetical protein
MDIFEFYEETRSKWGFEDGDAQPNGCYEVRDEIVKLINQNAPLHANIEAFEFDPFTTHNSCLIGYRHKKPDPVQIVRTESQSEDDEWLDEPEWVRDILAAAQDRDVFPLCHRIAVEVEVKDTPAFWKFGQWENGKFEVI